MLGDAAGSSSHARQAARVAVASNRPVPSPRVDIVNAMLQFARASRRAFVAVLVTAALVACGPPRDADVDTEPAADPQVVPAADDSTRVVYRSEVGEDVGVAIDILLDNSGSMRETVAGDERPKHEVAREAIQRMLDATDSALARRPDYPVRIALHVFSSDVDEVLPMQPYNRDSVRAALARVRRPRGGTAIGLGLQEARRALYRSGVYRKNVIVVTDGENTSGPSPDAVAREIFTRREGGVRMYFVAFDVAASNFAFASDVKGEVVGAANGAALEAALDTLYRGRVLAEALDAGEGTAPTAVAPALPAADSARGTDSTPSGRRSRRP